MSHDVKGNNSSYVQDNGAALLVSGATAMDAKIISFLGGVKAATDMTVTLAVEEISGYDVVLAHQQEAAAWLKWLESNRCTATERTDAIDGYNHEMVAAVEKEHDLIVGEIIRIQELLGSLTSERGDFHSLSVTPLTVDKARQLTRKDKFGVKQYLKVSPCTVYVCRVSPRVDRAKRMEDAKSKRDQFLSAGKIAGTTTRHGDGTTNQPPAPKPPVNGAAPVA